MITRKFKKLIKNTDWSSYIEDLKKSDDRKLPFGFLDMEHIHNCL